jgi:hypothetical protein
VSGNVFDIPSKCHTFVRNYKKSFEKPIISVKTNQNH